MSFLPTLKPHLTMFKVFANFWSKITTGGALGTYMIPGSKPGRGVCKESALLGALSL